MQQTSQGKLITLKVAFKITCTLFYFSFKYVNNLCTTETVNRTQHENVEKPLQ